MYNAIISLFLQVTVLCMTPGHSFPVSFVLRFILHAKKTAFVVEHDFIMATYLADRVIVFEGQPSVSTVANTLVFLLAFCVLLLVVVVTAVVLCTQLDVG